MEWELADQLESQVILARNISTISSRRLVLSVLALLSALIVTFVWLVVRVFYRLLS
jgi:hypothetical protein